MQMPPEHILIIDDTPASVTCICDALGDQYQFLVAERGITGIDLFLTHERKIIAVILDFQLPDIDGISVCAIIRQRNAEVPIVPFTRYASKMAAFRALGCATTLQKPATVPEVREAIEDARFTPVPAVAASPLLAIVQEQAVRLIDLQRTHSHLPLPSTQHAKLRADQRQQKILDLIRELGSVSSKQLCELLSFEIASTRRDLNILIAEDVLIRQGETNNVRYLLRKRVSPPNKHPLSDADIARFWSKVDRSGGDEACWIWRGGLSHNAGQFAVGDTMLQAHRISYSISNGPIRAGQLVIQHCSNRRCVNPAHLQLESRQRYRAQKGTQRQQARTENTDPLQGFCVGEYGELIVLPDESEYAAHQRLLASAMARHWHLRFDQHEGKIFFQVRQLDDEDAPQDT